MLIASDLTAELLSDIENRDAVDDIAANHNCTYTDIILIIGKSKAFNKFCSRHNKGGSQITAELPKGHKLIDWSVMTEPVLKLYQQGLSYPEIGEKLGISKDSVGNCLQRNGIHSRRDIRLKDEWKPDIIARYKAGEAMYKIALHYGINNGSVRHLLKVEGEIMKRLTERDKANFASIIGISSRFDDKLTNEEFLLVDAALNKLAAYEDIGLTPREVAEIIKQYGRINK
jgi:uncharacterized protein (DUF433 family)